MSGSSLSPWALVRDPINYAKQLADAANCTFDTSHQQLLKCFRECTLETLLSVPIDVPEFITPFGPNIDGVIIDPGITLPTKTAGIHIIVSSSNFLLTFFEIFRISIFTINKNDEASVVDTHLFVVEFDLESYIEIFSKYVIMFC